MHDELLSTAVKDAGETFEPPWLDVRTVTRRGRRRWWLTRAVAVTTSLALVGGAAAVAARIDVSEPRPAPAAASLRGWQPIGDAPISGRAETMSAWTGRELIVVGGAAADTGVALEDAAAYDPAAGEWERIPSPPEPMGGQTAVWTGRELILWGGEGDDDGHPRGSGFAFDAEARAWRELPEAPYWSFGGHSAVWTGSEMIVWGGVASGAVRAAAYDPATDEWERVPNGPLESRHAHEAVWAGDRMIVWGGLSLDAGVRFDGTAEGAEYDPAARRWSPLPASPLDASAPISFWTGREMVVTGGLGTKIASRAGAAYDPMARTWREIADVPLAAERGAPVPLVDMHTAPVWTGEQAAFVTADGVLSYDPDADAWSRVPAPRAAWRMNATVAWTGDEMLLWSGRTWDDEDYFTDGWSARQSAT